MTSTTTLKIAITTNATDASQAEVAEHVVRAMARYAENGFPKDSICCTDITPDRRFAVHIKRKGNE